MHYAVSNVFVTYICMYTHMCCRLVHTFLCLNHRGFRLPVTKAASANQNVTQIFDTWNPKSSSMFVPQCDDMSESGCGEHNHMVNDWLTVSDHMSVSQGVGNTIMM